MLLLNKDIDENSRKVGSGYVHGTDQLVLPCTVNTSGELLIEIIPHTLSTPFVASHLHIDENTHQISGGVTNDANQDITPLTVDLIVGFPCLRVEDPNL